MASTPGDYRPVEGSERHPGPSAQYLKPADPDEAITVTVMLRRRLDAAVPDLDYFAATPPGKRRRLSQKTFAARYGASPEDLQKVRSFARNHRLKVVETNAARRTVVLSGTVVQMSDAFRVTLGRYQHEVTRVPGGQPQTETYRGRDGVVQVPSDLAPIVMGVFGLDDRRITKRNAADPINTTTLTVPQVTRLYNFPANSAAGQTIAIFGEGGYKSSDIRAYFATLGAGHAAPTITDVAVGAGNSGKADGETTEDICVAATAAPGAAIAVYFIDHSQKGWVDLIQRVVHPGAGDPVCSVLSCSRFVSCGDDLATLMKEGVSEAWINAVTSAFQDAAIQGITVCIASGDCGTDSNVGDGKAHVQYPASDPWVLSVGGTTIGNSRDLSFDEYVWNDTFTLQGHHGEGATGGGVSDCFDLPSYQAGAHVPKSLNPGERIGRGVPDVAANASPNSGYPMIRNGKQFIANGTSAAAPLWAGLIAVLNAALGKNLGFVNPVFYQIAPRGFRDIVSPPGPADNGLSGVAGYPAEPGWDACTGWGSPDGQALLAALKAFRSPSPSAPSTSKTK